MIADIISQYLLFGILFTPELLICAAAFCMKLQRRNKFILRLIITILAYFALSVIFSAVLIINVENPAVYSVLQIIYYTLLWLTLITGIFICFQVGITGSVITAIGAYAAQHLSYSLYTLICFITTRSVNGIFIFFEPLFCIPVSAAVWFILLRNNDYSQNTEMRDHRLLPLAAFTFFSCITLNTVAVYFKQEETFSVLVWGVCRPYGILCSIFLLMIFFGFLRENSLQREKDMMEVLLRYEKEQHKIRTESAALINMKCHDLKHQLRLLRNADDKKAYDELYGEVTAVIDGFYDTNIKTGNDTLDLVLAEQIMRCNKLGISLDCSVDGEGLSFMKRSDISALFGNALDNAVEAVRELSEECKFISLTVKQSSGTVFVHTENCCGKVEFNGEMPVTDKPDKRYHGFGVKSIFHIANHYGGIAKVYVRNGKFNLDILFLLSEITEKVKKTT